MENEVIKVPIIRVSEEGLSSIDDIVVREFPLTIIFNNQELVTLLCSPKDLNYLATGFLFSEGLLSGKDEIKNILVDEQRGVVRFETENSNTEATELIFKRLITSGCGKGAAFYSTSDTSTQPEIKSQARISTDDVLSLAKEFQQCSEVFRTTGGVHSAALCDADRIILFSEDIGRHNAIDKIFGECLLKDIATDDRLILTSGRISSEILLKVAKRNIPILISKSAPTDLGVELANKLGITLLGFVRGKRINIYANEWRIVNDN